MSSDFWYFQHDSRSRNDIKLVRLDAEMGNNIGYALYFKTCEFMCEIGSGSIAIDDIPIVARSIGCSVSECRKYFDAAVKIGLFEIVENHIMSARFCDWIESKMKLSQKRSESGRAGGRPRKQIEEPGAVTMPVDESVRGVSEETVVKLNPISDEPKPRPNHTAECQRIFEVWNAQKIKVHRELTDQLRDALRKALRKHSVEQILSAIENYSQRLSDPNDFINYRWTLLEFVSRSNGLPVYVERAENTEQTKQLIATQTVKTHDGEDEKRKEESSLISKLNGSIWSGFGSLRELLSHLWKFPTPESKLTYIQTMPDRLQAIVTAPDSQPLRVMRQGVNENLAREYEEMKK